jgi:hypothetical protein
MWFIRHPSFKSSASQSARCAQPDLLGAYRSRFPFRHIPRHIEVPHADVFVQISGDCVCGQLTNTSAQTADEMSMHTSCCSLVFRLPWDGRPASESIVSKESKQRLSSWSHLHLVGIDCDQILTVFLYRLTRICRQRTVRLRTVEYRRPPLRNSYSMEASHWNALGIRVGVPWMVARTHCYIMICSDGVDRILDCAQR